MTTRLVHIPTGVTSWVANRIAEGTKDRSVLVLTCRLGAGDLLNAVEQAGGDMERVFVLDTIDRFTPVGREGNVITGLSLESIEIIAARANKIARAEAERDILMIVDFLDPIAQLMEPAAFGELASRIVHHMKQPTSLHDWIYTDVDPESLAAIRPVIDEEITASS